LEETIKTASFSKKTSELKEIPKSDPYRKFDIGQQLGKRKSIESMDFEKELELNDFVMKGSVKGQNMLGEIKNIEDEELE